MADKKQGTLRKRYELTEFYCEIHRGWHRITEDQFQKCINLLASYHTFKVSALMK
jgi:hypothetical protein